MASGKTAELLIPFLVCFGVSLILTRGFREIAVYFNLYDETGERKIHDTPKPYLGGLSVFLGFFIPLLMFKGDPVIFYFFVGAVLITSLGLIDDLYGLSGTTKLVGIALAVFVVSPTGLQTDLFSDFEYGFYLNFTFTLLWTLLIVSAFNAIDNMDGLATGLALVAALVFFVVGSVQFSRTLWGFISLCFAGALLGFLPYNFYPSIIFLGDSGSFLIGYVLALLSVMGEWSTHPLKAIIIPVVVLIIPILDLLFLIVFRYATGKTDGLMESIEYSARDHLSHRIQQVRNFGQRRTVLIIYVLGIISGLIGIIMRNTHPFEATAAFAAVCLLYFLVILLLLPNINNILWRW